MKVIRKILEGKPDQYWTGKKFDSDINRALEIRGGRHAALEKRNALRELNKQKPDLQKSERVVFTEGYEDSSEDLSFKNSYQSKREDKIRSQYIDKTILKPDGNLDPSKVDEVSKINFENKRLEAKLSEKNNVTLRNDRVVSPQKKDSPE